MLGDKCREIWRNYCQPSELDGVYQKLLQMTYEKELDGNTVCHLIEQMTESYVEKITQACRQIIEAMGAEYGNNIRIADFSADVEWLFENMQLTANRFNNLIKTFAVRLSDGDDAVNLPICRQPIYFLTEATLDKMAGN